MRCDAVRSNAVRCVFPARGASTNGGESARVRESPSANHRIACAPPAGQSRRPLGRMSAPGVWQTAPARRGSCREADCNGREEISGVCQGHREGVVPRGGPGGAGLGGTRRDGLKRDDMEECRAEYGGVPDGWRKGGSGLGEMKTARRGEADKDDAGIAGDQAGGRRLDDGRAKGHWGWGGPVRAARALSLRTRRGGPGRGPRGLAAPPPPRHTSSLPTPPLPTRAEPTHGPPRPARPATARQARHGPATDRHGLPHGPATARHGPATARTARRPRPRPPRPRHAPHWPRQAPATARHGPPGRPRPARPPPRRHGRRTARSGPARPATAARPHGAPDRHGPPRSTPTAPPRTTHDRHGPCRQTRSEHATTRTARTAPPRPARPGHRKEEKGGGGGRFVKNLTLAQGKSVPPKGLRKATVAAAVGSLMSPPWHRRLVTAVSTVYTTIERCKAWHLLARAFQPLTQFARASCACSQWADSWTPAMAITSFAFGT
ncbi:Protein of unknown function [Gryllus bimaculatus]|nr:Protein of unknown function [Gryllus bimaculatus]